MGGDVPTIYTVANPIEIGFAVESNSASAPQLVPISDEPTSGVVGSAFGTPNDGRSRVREGRGGYTARHVRSANSGDVAAPAQPSAAEPACSDSPYYEPVDTLCDGLDNDCDGLVDEGYHVGQPCDIATDADSCERGTYQCRADQLGEECVNDTLSTPEVFCNGIDDDCDGELDEGRTNVWYRDCDGDYFGEADGPTVAACVAPRTEPCGTGSRWVSNQRDCNDDARRDGGRFYPSEDTNGDGVLDRSEDANGNSALDLGAFELCDYVDNDCDLVIDEAWTRPDRDRAQSALFEGCDGTDADSCNDDLWLCNSAGDDLECRSAAASVYLRYNGLAAGSIAELEDWSGNDVSCTLRNSAVLHDNPSISGQSLSLRGDSAHVECDELGDAHPTAYFSAAMWIYVDKDIDCDASAAVDNARLLMAKRSGTGGWSMTIHDDQTLSFNLTTRDGSEYLRSTTSGSSTTAGEPEGNWAPDGSVATGTWTHVGFTYNGPTGVQRIFVNGERVAERRGAPAVMEPSIGQLRIGAWTYGESCPTAGGGFPGWVDETMVLARDVGEDGMRNIYRGGGIDALASAELCDGRDNDCDGDIDEAWTEVAVIGGVPNATVDCDGADSDQCENGVFVCAADREGIECGAEDMTDIVEICDGADNDCDTNVDEDYANLSAACDGRDADLCPEGYVICSADGSGTVCSDNTADNRDLCNGRNDDCDASTSDGAHEAWLGDTCDDADADVCALGAFVCFGGSQSCFGDTDQREVCDGADNTCDGNVDETFTNLGDTCYAGVGACRSEGAYACTADQTRTMCSAVANNSNARSELCNGINDDCDATVDEGAVASELTLTVESGVVVRDAELDCDFNDGTHDDGDDDTYPCTVATIIVTSEGTDAIGSDAVLEYRDDVTGTVLLSTTLGADLVPGEQRTITFCYHTAADSTGGEVAARLDDAAAGGFECLPGTWVTYDVAHYVQCGAEICDGFDNDGDGAFDMADFNDSVCINQMPNDVNAGFYVCNHDNNRTCVTDADCGSGPDSVCGAGSICFTCSAASGAEDDCDVDDDCSLGNICADHICVSGGMAEPFSADAGNDANGANAMEPQGGCSTAPAKSAPLGGIALVGLGMLVGTRRRRRRSA